MSLLERIGVTLPIIQAPMAGTSTPQMAAAVTNAGALGSIAVGAVNATTARQMMDATRAATTGPFNVNLFCHQPAQPDPARTTAWLQALAPEFAKFGATPPATLNEIYQSFVTDDDMLEQLLSVRPAVVSFHFGLPAATKIRRLRQAGIILLSTATNLAEAAAAKAAGIDAVIAQGAEAGGHRGVFNPAEPDDQLPTLTLTKMIATTLDLPVIAAGGIMTGADLAVALSHGAIAAQLGTAFIASPESSADAAHREALFSPAAANTVMTKAISGRPARCLANSFTRLGETTLATLPPPDYPLTYDAGKALNAAAKSHGDGSYGAQWAGQGAPRSRVMPAAALIDLLRRELETSK